MPFVQITMLAGRTAEQKRKIAERVTDALVDKAGVRRGATKTASDLNFDETVARAESDARGKALMYLAQAVVQRLAKSDN